MGQKILLLQQLNSKMQSFATLKKIAMPPTGWIRATRLALGMSAQQLGNKLSITRQGAMDIERREKEGSITLKTLQETAKALDMKLVYGFVPNDGSLEELVERKARAMATHIVMRTSTSMVLEEQGVHSERIAKAIEELTEEIKREIPKTLWD
jgi:predicted DNA-binding mobile mystery protein A